MYVPEACLGGDVSIVGAVEQDGQSGVDDGVHVAGHVVVEEGATM